MRRHLLSVVILPALVATVLAGQAFAQTLTAEQVVEKHLAAVGGREALSKITSRKATGTMIIGTPQGNLSGPVEMTAKSPNKMRASIRVDLAALGAAGEMAIDQLFDGTTGWMMNSMSGDQPMSGDQLAGAKNAFFPSPFLNYAEHGFTIAVKPSEKVNNKDAYVLLMTPKAGPAARMYFDAETFMLVRSVSRIVNPQLGEVEQISEPSDYRTVDGVKVAFLILQSAGGQDEIRQDREQRPGRRRGVHQEVVRAVSAAPGR